jgi:hypothetical protein
MRKHRGLYRRSESGQGAKVIAGPGLRLNISAENEIIYLIYNLHSANITVHSLVGHHKTQSAATTSHLRSLKAVRKLSCKQNAGSPEKPITF